MNITFPQTRAGRRLPFWAVAIAGTALGISAGVGVWQIADSTSGPSQIAVTTLPASYQSTRDDRSLVLYLVESQAQEDLVMAGEQEAARERESANAPDPNYVLAVMKATTPEEEQNVREILEAWSNSNSGVHLVDLRTQ